LPPTTSGLETEWDYSGRKRGRDGQKKKIGKANEKMKMGKEKKSKRCGSEWTRGKGEGVPGPTRGPAEGRRLNWHIDVFGPSENGHPSQY